MSLEKIVCYIDLDNNSRKGVQLSGAIAENRGCSVEIVLAAAKMPFYSSSIGGEVLFTPPSVSLDIFRKSMEAADQRIDEAVQTLESENAGGEISAHRLDNHQVDALIEHARTLDADLIVMSSEPAGLFDRLFHRIFAERLARQSVCPVLVMSGDTEVVPPLQTILVAVDYSEASRSAAFVAREILSDEGVMHFQHVWAGHSAPGLHLSRQEGDAPADDQPAPLGMVPQTEVQRLEEFVRSLHLTEIETQCHVTSGTPHESINALAIAIECDVVVVGSRPHDDWSKKLFGTVADRLIESSRKPVLSVPKRFNASRPLSKLDMTIDQSFPASDAPSSWAGP